MRWIGLFFLIVFGTAIAVIQPLQAKDSSLTLGKASVCESFGVQRFEARKEASPLSLSKI